MSTTNTLPYLLHAFFDDWLVQESRGIVREWFRAEPWPGLEPAADPLLQVSYNSPDVLYDRETGTWRMWASFAPLSVSGTGNRASLSVPVLMLEALRPVSPAPEPAYELDAFESVRALPYAPRSDAPGSVPIRFPALV